MDVLVAGGAKRRTKSRAKLSWHQAAQGSARNPAQPPLPQGAGLWQSIVGGRALQWSLAAPMAYFPA